MYCRVGVEPIEQGVAEKGQKLKENNSVVFVLWQQARIASVTRPNI